MPIKILVVDDSHDTTWLLKRTLIEENYDVEIALNGLEGLRMAYNYRLDLVLLDVMMPEMDGFEVCRRLKGSDSTRLIPVILVARNEASSGEK